MNIQQKTYNALNAITGLVNNVFPDVLPEQPTYPACAYQFTSAQPAPGYIASARKSEFIVTVTIYESEVPTGGGYAALLTKRQAVIAAFESMSECESRIMDMSGGFEFSTKTYSWIFTFRLIDVES